MTEELTDHDFASIGRALTTFSVLEHELLRAIVAMNGGHDDPEEAESGFADRFIVIVEGGFRRRVQVFVSEYIRVLGEDAWIREFEAAMNDANDVRDHVAHGVFEKSSEGHMKCTFFSRNAIRCGYAASFQTFTPGDLNMIAMYNKQAARQILEMFGTD